MAAPSTVPNTTGASMNNFWKYVQGPVSKYIWNHGKRPEKQWFDTLPKSEMPWSALSMTAPAELLERGVVASIPDSGAMAYTASTNAVPYSVSDIHLNSRFSVSNQVQWGDEGARNQILPQLRAQALQVGFSMNEDWSDRFYGFPTALLATTDTDISGTSGTLTLTNGFGSTSITNARYITNLFKTGTSVNVGADRIALADSSNTLLGFGTVTAKDATAGTITATFDASITATANGIKIYKANNIEAATLAGGSDYLKGLNGLMELYTSTSTLNISGSTYASWNPSYTLTAAGRFSWATYRKARNAMKNESSYDTDFMWMAQGVGVDLAAQERAGLRYSSSADLNIDGNVRAKGVDIMEAKGVPPGFVFGGTTEVFRRHEILPMEGDDQYNQLQKFENYAASFGRMDWFGQMYVVSRRGLWYVSSATEQ